MRKENSPTGDLCLGFESFNQRSVRLLQGALDECSKKDVAAHVNIFADVKTSSGCADTELDGLAWFVGEGAVDGPFVSDSESSRRIAMRLQTVAEIVEGAGVSDVACAEVARKIGDLVCQRVPDAVTFF